MSNHADSTVTLQTSAESVLSPPSWFGEVTVIARYLQRVRVLSAIEKRVITIRPRSAKSSVIDFMAVLLSYAIIRI